MQSPVTGKTMKLVKQPGTKLNFRKEEFEINYHYYLCEDSGERFTSDELDRINTTQIHNMYRERYGVPFPDEIREIREKYDISASKMSEILGFGANSYRLYESGEIPSVANGRLILAIREPKDFIKQVEASSHLLTAKEKEKFIKKAEELALQQKVNAWNIMLTKHIFTNQVANEFSGYRRPDYAKIAAAITVLGKEIALFKTKLNKLLFYSDFLFFNISGFSMTGISYRAIQMGPVPAAYSNLYDKLCENNFIEIDQVAFDENIYGDVIKGVFPDPESLLSDEEMGVLNSVIDQLGKLTTKNIIERSHQEKAWIENYEEKELISYSKYAFDLNEFGNA
jgi:putative zinc finger/helix-turn-helix YgiT family protein